MQKKIKKKLNLVTCVVAVFFAVLVFAGNVFADNSGIFLSEVIDTGHKNVTWGNLEWTAAAPAGTQIVLKVRTSNSDTMAGATEFSSCSAVVTVNSANTTGTAATSSNSCVHSGDRYYQYEATLSSTNDDVPELQEAKVNYSYYTPSPSSDLVKTSDADFGANTNSNVGISGSGTNALITLLKADHAVCTSDSDCSNGNCDTDFATVTKYCHSTASSCADSSGDPWEQVDGYEKCSGNDYYKSCSNSTWGAQQNNPNPSNAYCDAGGGAQSGYQLAATCTNSTSGGFNAPACNSCSPYKTASTSSCSRNSCTTDSDCINTYICSGGTCLNPWVSGPCAGMQVYYQDATPASLAWRNSNGDCNTPQCGQNGAQDGDTLVANNAVDFSVYPARNACKTLGGRLPSIAELQCITSNKASYGNNFASSYGFYLGYWSNAEKSDTHAYIVSLQTGATDGVNYQKISNGFVRCVK